MIRAKPLGACPRPKAERLLKGKAVTIAAGLVCSNGIVIAADGEVSHGFVKSSKVKLFECALSKSVALIGAGSGDELFVDSVVQKIQEDAVLAAPDVGSVKAEVERIAAQCCLNAWPLYEASNKPDLSLLIAVSALDGMRLMEVNGPMVRFLPEHGFIGYGRELAIYKMKQMFMADQTTEIAEPLVVGLIKTVKDNVLYCGGETSVWVLRSDGRKEVRSQDSIREIELAHTAYEKLANLLLVLLPLIPVKDRTAIQMLAAAQFPPREELQKNFSRAVESLIAALRTSGKYNPATLSTSQKSELEP